MLSDFAVVICHGYFHTPAPYQPLIDAFSSQGIDAYCPQLATSDLFKLNVGDVEHPNFDLGPPTDGYPSGDEDAKIVLEVIRPLIEKQAKKILLVAHSAGGWAATQAAIPELQAKTRSSQGLQGGIIGIFYYGAFIIPVGESINSFFQPKDALPLMPPWMQYHVSLPALDLLTLPLTEPISQAHGPDGLGTLILPEKFMFNDLDHEEAEKWAKTLTASPNGTTKLTNDAYAALPCAYLVLEGDQTLAKEYQEGMIALQAGKTGEFKIYRCPTGHSAHLSWTDGIVGVAQDFVGGL
ncbi:hypothetical protein N0V90_012048 [Kalmusia sp. IMI 367209]|nr:hypothetical protein N0V90_012048 [Kalmusia sp. IMI 367209]